MYIWLFVFAVVWLCDECECTRKQDYMRTVKRATRRLAQRNGRNDTDGIQMYSRSSNDGLNTNSKSVSPVSSPFTWTEEPKAETVSYDYRDQLLFLLQNGERFVREIDTNPQLMRALIGQSVLGRPALHLVAESGNGELMKYIHQHLTTSESTKLSSLTTVLEGNTLLHSAILSEKAEMVSVVAHAFPYLRSMPNHAGQCPLEFALRQQANEPIVMQLVTAGCRMESKEMLAQVRRVNEEGCYRKILSQLKELSRWFPHKHAEMQSILSSRLLTTMEMTDNLSTYGVFYFKLLKMFRQMIYDEDDASRCVSPGAGSESPCPMRRTFSEGSDAGSVSLENASPKTRPGVMRLADLIVSDEFRDAAREEKATSLRSIANSKCLHAGVCRTELLNHLVEICDFKLFVQFTRSSTGIDRYYCIRFLSKSTTTMGEDLKAIFNALTPDVNAHFFDGLCPIHVAVMQSNVTMLKMLVGRGARMDQKTRFEQDTVLHLAVSREDVDPQLLDHVLETCPRLLSERNALGQCPLETVLALGPRANLDTVLRLLHASESAPALDNDIAVYAEMKSILERDPLDCRLTEILEFAQTSNVSCAALISFVAQRALASVFNGTSGRFKGA